MVCKLYTKQLLKQKAEYGTWPEISGAEEKGIGDRLMRDTDLEPGLTWTSRDGRKLHYVQRTRTVQRKVLRMCS